MDEAYILAQWHMHTLAFAIGFVLDLIFGDPQWLPHPVRLIGRRIEVLELRYNRTELSAAQRRQGGRLLALRVLLETGVVAGGLLYLAYRIAPWLGAAVESVMTYQLLAAKGLWQESVKVYARLRENDLSGARAAVAMIVGRDTAELDEAGIVRAAVETVAENTSDGVIAPLLYLAVGGPLLGFLYKAINTMDSMIAYKNERYLEFGRTAAKLDDAANFLPARISAVLMIAATVFFETITQGVKESGRSAANAAGSGMPEEESFGGRYYDGARAYRIWKRDRRRHASPNSAQTESACAGALGIRLGGPAVYFGKREKKPWIGDDLRPAEPEDIRRADRLMLGTAVLGEFVCLNLMLLP